ncbi:hypothetical protein FRB90_004867 [Tulasnella sp. 427]|nr:hypothetical protein FRB90_004867 [Tulasnella sp. 427]
MSENVLGHIALVNNASQEVIMEAIDLAHGTAGIPLPQRLNPGQSEEFTIKPDAFGIEGQMTCVVDADKKTAIIAFTNPNLGVNTYNVTDNSKITEVTGIINAAGPLELTIIFSDRNAA